MTRGRYGIFGAAASGLWIAGVLFAGCAAERTVHTTDAALGYEALRDGGMAVVGVTVMEEVEQVRPPLNAALEKVLRDWRPDLSVRTADSIRDLLGLVEFRRIQTAYQLAGNLSETDRVALAARLRSSARFALLARVEKDDVRQPPTRRQSSRQVGAAAPNFGIFAASRDARIRITLYDLANGQEAWAAFYDSSTKNALPDSVSQLPAKLLVPPPGAKGERPLDPLPEVPSLAEALLEGFRAFAADLPRPPEEPAAPAP